MSASVTALLALCTKFCFTENMVAKNLEEISGFSLSQIQLQLPLAPQTCLEGVSSQNHKGKAWCLAALSFSLLLVGGRA